MQAGQERVFRAIHQNKAERTEVVPRLTKTFEFLFAVPRFGSVCRGPRSKGRVKADADVLLFTDGERLTGHFVKPSGAALTFKSDALGEITVDWSEVKELQSSAKVAVIPKGLRLRKRQDAATVPQGTLSVQDQQVRLADPSQTMPVSDAGQIIDQTGF
jgi:hypothetical protein